VSGSGISWAICKSAPRSRQITTPAPHTQLFTGRMPFLPPNQQRQSTEGTSTKGTLLPKLIKLETNINMLVTTTVKLCGVMVEALDYDLKVNC